MIHLTNTNTTRNIPKTRLDTTANVPDFNVNKFPDYFEKTLNAAEYRDTISKYTNKEKRHDQIYHKYDLQFYEEVPKIKATSFNIKECIDAFLELEKKQIGDIYLTGSVALYLQGKLDRDSFKDLDIIAIGEVELDDDMSDLNVGSYPRINDNKEQKRLLFNGIPIDIFVFDKDSNGIETIEVPYEDVKIKCQEYKGIIDAKLNMAFQSLKDKEYLLENIFKITFK